MGPAKKLPKGQEAHEWYALFVAAIHGGAGAIALPHEARVPAQVFVDWCDEVATLGLGRAVERGAIE